ncbi:MAG TPA: UDP-2,3-diacylglucosamine diphosphatase [Bacteroidetes bacterium]|nr:UDP-2,3-diacylglucosamine diphosphatase [Bacteroidota bacterium]
MDSFNTSPRHRALIVADAHLPLDGRPGGEEELAAFRDLLRATRKDTALVILLGDIFDFWFEWSHVIPKRAVPLLYDLHDFVRDGVEVHFFAGNHDFRLHGFLDAELGFRLHMDAWTPTIDGRRVFIHHGDGMDATDRRYLIMKRLFRDPAAQRTFSLTLHPDLAMQIGRMTSSLGRRRQSGYPDGKKPDGPYIERAEEILRRGYDLVIFGHTHHARLRQLADGWYHNPGPFLRERRYSVIEGDLPRGEVLS